MTVSATEAAFEGFRVTRRNPGVVLIWAGVWLIGLIGLIWLVGLNGSCVIATPRGR